MTAARHFPSQKPVRAAATEPRPVRRPPGLPVRFVTRISRELSGAIADAARRDGVTAGAFVRRMLLERVAIQSAADARSGRPVRQPDDDAAAIAAAIRELAAVNAAISMKDLAAAKMSLTTVREILIPLVIRQARR
ncbi:hypothetical protein [Methylobacterium sp. BTF04]|uniref:hypothetical protein n=1 Tax=Methylobacterium sp. BTF04 TaxID=2708300 RepID=UPI001952BFB2|nr:hypothetical protein [Methylobacterium sp. BTF04]